MMQSEKSKLNFFFYLFSCFTVVTHLGTDEMWGAFVFQVKGGQED